MCAFAGTASKAGLLDASLSTASTARTALLSIAATCESAVPLLETNCAASSLHLTDAISSLVVPVQRSIPSFVSAARAHWDAVDKRLEMQGDELSDTIKMFQACLQLTFTGTLTDGAVPDVRESFAMIRRLFDCRDAVPDVSTLLCPSGSDAARCVSDLSRVNLGIDPTRSQVSHAKWLARGEVWKGTTTSNIVSITAVDSTSEPVFGVTSADVAVSFSSGSVGWTVPFVSVEVNAVKLEVMLTLACSDAAVLHANIGGAAFAIPLKVRPSMSDAHKHTRMCILNSPFLSGFVGMCISSYANCSSGGV